MHPISYRNSISATILKQSLQSVLQGRGIENIAYSPHRDYFSDCPLIQKVLDWFFCVRHGIDADLCQFISTHSESILRQILSFKAPDDDLALCSMNRPIEIGHCYGARSAIRIELSADNVIFSQLRLPRFDQATVPGAVRRLCEEKSQRIESVDTLPIPFSALRSECLRAYIEQASRNSVPDFHGMELSGLDISTLRHMDPVLGNSLIDAGVCPRQVLRQYLAIVRSNGAVNIDISGFRWSEIDLTNLDLHGVDVESLLAHVEPEQRAALCKKFDNAIVDMASREHLILIGSPTQIVACPVPVSGRTLLGEDEEFVGNDFRKLAVELHDLHLRGQYLGNIDLAHLRRHDHSVFYVSWENAETAETAVAQRLDVCDHPMEQCRELDARKQDQFDFFSAVVAACMPGVNKSVAIAGVVSSLTCSVALKSELMLFLLDPYNEGHVLRAPLEDYLDAPPKRRTARPIIVQAAPVHDASGPVEIAEATNIPVSASRIVSKSDSGGFDESGSTGVRSSKVERSAAPNLTGQSNAEKLERLCKLFQQPGNLAYKRNLIEQLIEANLLNEFLAGLPAPNLSHVDLSNLNLSGIDFTFADLSYTKLDNSIFLNSAFRGANLRGTILVGENMGNADLRLAELDGATLTGSFTARLNNLAGARVINANLERAEICRLIPGLPGVNRHFQGATLSNVSLAGMNLKYVDFRGATLDRVNVTGTVLSQTCFNNARVKSVKFYEARSLGQMTVNDKMLASLSLPTKEYLLYQISVGRIIKQ